jgi:hypothetical protein
MATLNKASYEAKYNDAGTGIFKTGQSRGIGSDDTRALVEDTSDSVPFTADDSYTWSSPQVTASGTNTYAATPSPAITAYATGQKFQIKFTNAASGVSTLNLNGIGAKKIFINPTTQATTAHIVANQISLLVYDATLDTEAGGFLMIGAPSTTTGTVESVTGDGVDNTDPANPIVSGTTRELNRTFTTELLFDYDYIEARLHVQTDDITFTVAEGGHLTDRPSVYAQRIYLDGVHPVYFPSFNHFANFNSGDILEEGTYQFYFMYSSTEDGEIVRGSIMLPREETVMLTPLIAPTDFQMVPGAGDPETEIDATWTVVANASSGVIELSEEGGGGPWILPITLAGSATSYTRTGLTPNTTYHQRYRAIGDGVTFANSQYVIDATTTQDAGDITDPTAISTPVDTATDIVVNRVVVITWDEALRDSDGVTEITNANVLDYITAVNSSAGAQAITATIDVTKKIFTITPDTVWDENEDITITIDGVEDGNGNEPAPFVITFSTSDFTEMEGDVLSLGNQIDSIIVGADKNFEIEIDLNDLLLLNGAFVAKYGTGSGDSQFSILIRIVDNNVEFRFYNTVAIGGIFKFRSIQWPDALLGFTSGKLTWEYFGAIDTNNGLDRVGFYIDDVLITSGKNINIASSGGWPFDIGVSTAPFRLTSSSFREARNLIIRNNMGATTVVNIPIIRTGIDVSGNNFHGTWI